MRKILACILCIMCVSCNWGNIYAEEREDINEKSLIAKSAVLIDGEIGRASCRERV